MYYLKNYGLMFVKKCSTEGKNATKGIPTKGMNFKYFVYLVR